MTASSDHVDDLVAEMLLQGHAGRIRKDVDYLQHMEDPEAKPMGIPARRSFAAIISLFFAIALAAGSFGAIQVADIHALEPSMIQEFSSIAYGAQPAVDSDGDGLSDALELLVGSDPLDPLQPVTDGKVTLLHFSHHGNDTIQVAVAAAGAHILHGDTLVFGAPPDPDGNGTDDPDGNGTDDPDGNETGDPDGNSTDNPDGNETDDPDGNHTDDPDGNETGGPDGNNTDDPDGNQTDDPDGNETGGPDGNATDDPDGNETGGPDGNATDDPDGNQTDDPDGNETSDPDGNQTDGPDGNSTNDPDGNHTGGPEGNHTDDPDGNETDEPVEDQRRPRGGGGRPRAVAPAADSESPEPIPAPPAPARPPERSDVNDPETDQSQDPAILEEPSAWSRDRALTASQAPTLATHDQVRQDPKRPSRKVAMLMGE